jgi:cyclic lactone autoinducer peptide
MKLITKTLGKIPNAFMSLMCLLSVGVASNSVDIACIWFLHQPDEPLVLRQKRPC